MSRKMEVMWTIWKHGNIKPPDAEAGKFWENWIYTTTADDYTLKIHIKSARDWWLNCVQKHSKLQNVYMFMNIPHIAGVATYLKFLRQLVPYYITEIQLIAAKHEKTYNILETLHDLWKHEPFLKYLLGICLCWLCNQRCSANNQFHCRWHFP